MFAIIGSLSRNFDFLEHPPAESNFRVADNPGANGPSTSEVSSYCRYFFNAACQLSTTLNGVCAFEPSSPAEANRLPSGATSQFSVGTD